MIEEQAEVTAIEGPYAWVTCRAQQDCARCAEGKGCGGGILGRWLGDRLHRVRVTYQGDLGIGDCVVIGLDERVLFSLALLVYGLPLVLMFVGAALGHGWIGGDVAAGVGMLVGLSVGFAWVHGFSRKMRLVRQFQPMVMRRVFSAESK